MRHRRTQPFAVDAEGVTLYVRLTPRGGRDALEGVEAMADGQVVLKARVSAAPERGLANAALAKLVAKVLGVPKSSVSVAAGETARVKALRVAGDPLRLSGRCEALCAAAVRPRAARSGAD